MLCKKSIGADISATRPQHIKTKDEVVLVHCGRAVDISPTSTQNKDETGSRLALACRKLTPKKLKRSRQSEEELLPTRTSIVFRTLKTKKNIVLTYNKAKLNYLCVHLCYIKHNYPKEERSTKRLIYPQTVRKRQKFSGYIRHLPGSG